MIIFVAVTRLCFADLWQRAEYQYLFVIALGYGHLIGATVFGLRRMKRFVPARFPPWLVGAVVGIGVVDLFVLYAWASNVATLIVLPLLTISIWHVVENDLALRSLRASGAIAPVARSREVHVAAFGATALLLTVGQQLLGSAAREAWIESAVLVEVGAPVARATAIGCGAWVALRARENLKRFGLAVAGTAVLWPAWESALSFFSFGDFFTAVTLYHLVQFLELFARRIRRTEDPVARRSMRRRLFWVHVPPFAVCAVLLLLPGDALSALRYAVFSPTIYLFWSVLHVGQTLLTRGLEPQRFAGSPAVAT